MYKQVTVVLLLGISFVLLAVLPACGGSATSDWAWERAESESALAVAQAPAAPTAAMAPAPASAPQLFKYQNTPASPQAPAAPAPAAAAAPTLKQVASVVKTEAMSEDSSAPTQLVTQRRIIIREVDMSLVVDEIQGAIDEIADIADDTGGWVVDSGRRALHSGSISIRVPSEVLDDIIEELRLLANKVEYENTSSRDVTDEYVDLGARLKNQQATQEALLGLLKQATTVEAALAVQRDLSQVQEEVERLSGRIKFLEESAAFSIIRVNLSLAPVEVTVDTGPDLTVAVGAPVGVRATFSPPDSIEDYVITWDFGDASEPQTVYRTAATQSPGELTTATVNHFYTDTTGSPFIAEVSITGTGEGGIVEGKDTLTISVSEIPAIEVYAGSRQDVVQNMEVSFSGSFTRPQGLTNATFEWDFGDGLPPVIGDLEEGVTRANATHVFGDFRPEPYAARLTIRADSEVGEIEASDVVQVRVREQLGFVVGGYEFERTFKSAVRGLSAFVQSAAVVLIWLAIFVPIWAAIGAIIWLVVKAWRWRRSRSGNTSDEQSVDTDA